MSEYEIDLDSTPITSEAEKRGMTRDEAIAWGRRLGEDEANRRGEIETMREERIARAGAYAEWDYDGRPVTGWQNAKAIAGKPDFKEKRK